jgi:hypothetical protein
MKCMYSITILVHLPPFSKLFWSVKTHRMSLFVCFIMYLYNFSFKQFLLLWKLMRCSREMSTVTHKLTKTAMCQQILVKLPNIKFNEEIFTTSHVVTWRQTWVKLTGAFLQLFAETPAKTCQDRQWTRSNRSQMRYHLRQPVFSEEDGDIKFLQNITI